MIEYHTPGNHVRLHIGADARIHITRNKEEILSIDVEPVFDELVAFLVKSKCRRPGVRRRKAMVEFGMQEMKRQEGKEQPF